jgi:hypothetical protein
MQRVSIAAQQEAIRLGEGMTRALMAGWPKCLHATTASSLDLRGSLLAFSASPEKTS